MTKENRYGKALFVAAVSTEINWGLGRTRYLSVARNINLKPPTGPHYKVTCR